MDTMSEKNIDTRRVLKTLCWHLNHHNSEDMPTEQIAEEMGLEWGTVYNHILIIDMLNRIAPEITFDNGNVTVDSSASATEQLLSDDALAVGNYIFMCGLVDSDVSREIDISDHEFLSTRETTIENMVELDWIDRDGNTIKLTPNGISVIGPAQSSVTNGV